MAVHRFVLLCLLVGQQRCSAESVFAAVARDDAAAVTSLAVGDALNAKGPGGQSPLMHAVLTGKPVAVGALLKLGADPTVAEQDGYTPMHGAGFQGRAAIATMLVAAGLDPSDRHRDGFTPLHRACWGGDARHTETVVVLLEAGVSPGEKSSDGKVCAQVTQNAGTLSALKAWQEKGGKDL